ncbi:MAG: zf-HC2 domain-containing protein [Roseiflexus sp.]|nr:zf-HC2 domain-containing protein [Roseiflexus sp.]MCS7289046.1 zf-HC2 domain-containing protein [Roseiflexus sp.]MDW8148391.1 zf-HC2 domain-containing protein [Roseiflexaceae bacterium]MDW8232712.1 zf-HC2 domain-containing protein [Roseiflexaceae bacterium]
MTCEELIAHLSSYLDHEMDAALVAEVQEHIARCRNCRVVLDTTQRLIVLVHDEGRRVIPASQRSALFERLQQAFLNRPQTLENSNLRTAEDSAV